MALEKEGSWLDRVNFKKLAMVLAMIVAACAVFFVIVVTVFLYYQTHNKYVKLATHTVNECIDAYNKVYSDRFGSINGQELLNKIDDMKRKNKELCREKRRRCIR